jgi:hypothetical protein
MRSLFRLITDPRKYAANQTLDTRERAHRLYQSIRPAERRIRRELLPDAQRGIAPIPDDAGFRRMDDLDPSLVREVVDAGRRLRDSLDLPDLVRRAPRKFLITYPLDPKDAQNPFLKFALHPPIVRMVADYIGMLPVIENLYLWYSPNEANQAGSSQYFHLDAQDVRTVQIFVYLHDVEPDCGPFVLIEAAASERLQRAVGYRKAGSLKRLSDEVVAQHVRPEEMHTLTGPAGSVFVCDSDRCFHYGSRQASKPRFLLAFQYYTPYAFALPWKYWKQLPLSPLAARPGFSPVEQLVLGAPRPR